MLYSTCDDSTCPTVPPHEEHCEAIEDRYAVVARPGAGVARVRVALTDIAKAKPLMKLMPTGVVLGTGAGGLSMEAELVDSQSGKQLGAVIEVQDGSRLPLDGLGRLSDAKAIIDDWASRFRSQLDAAHRQ